jgi:hypothetical protein
MSSGTNSLKRLEVTKHHVLHNHSQHSVRPASLLQKKRLYCTFGELAARRQEVKTIFDSSRFKFYRREKKLKATKKGSSKLNWD